VVEPAAPEKKPKRRIGDNVVSLPLSRLRQDIASWRNGVDMAENKTGYDRFDLYELYKEIKDDGQVIATTGSRTDNITLSDFSIYVGDEQNDGAQNLFEQRWFFDFLKYSVESFFWGAKIVQIDSINPLKISCVPDENVAVEYDAVKKLATGGVSSGNLVTYVGNEYEPLTIPVYNSQHDLGIFNAVAPYYLWKKVLGAWSEYADRFGMPLRAIHTDIDDPERVKHAQDMLENMIGSTYAIFHMDDRFEINQLPGREGFQVYAKLIDYCDSQIAKIMLRQTGTTDEKAYSGSSLVHADVLGSLAKSDKKYIQYLINDTLIPKLVGLGIVPMGTRFYWDSSDNVSTLEKVNIIQILTNSGYKIPAEYVEKWTGVEVEHVEEVELTEIEEPEETTAIMDVEDYMPGTMRKKSLGMGISMLTVMKDGVATPRAYKFDPKIFKPADVENYLRTHGIKATDVWHAQ